MLLVLVYAENLQKCKRYMTDALKTAKDVMKIITEASAIYFRENSPEIVHLTTAQRSVCSLTRKLRML